MKINIKQANWPKEFNRRYLKDLIVAPLTRLIKEQTKASQRLAEEKSAKIQELGEFVEIIARQIKRLSDQEK